MSRVSRLPLARVISRWYHDHPFDRSPHLMIGSSTTMNPFQTIRAVSIAILSGPCSACMVKRLCPALLPYGHIQRNKDYSSRNYFIMLPSSVDFFGFGFGLRGVCQGDQPHSDMGLPILRHSSEHSSHSACLAGGCLRLPLLLLACADSHKGQ